MRLTNCLSLTALAIGALLAAVPTTATAKPTVAQALGLKPIQKEVDYTTPADDEIANCVLKAESTDARTGWVVRDGQGLLLRRFIDSNGDNKVDLWCYYKDGIEVYRDVDENFNGKADQYRWLGTAGIRWGLDLNEDGRVDSWKAISAEEVTAEVVAALRDRDARRFAALLISGDELEASGLGEEHRRQIKERIQRASGEFAKFAGDQKVVQSGTHWIHFGATRPGVVPAGTSGATQDLTVYENVVAVVETDGKPAQAPVGTLLRVGDAWRLIDVPPGSTEDAVATLGSGFFFASSQSSPPAGAVSAATSEKWQQLIRKLEAIDAELVNAANPADQASLNRQRADVIEQLIGSLPGDEQETWIRQFADSVSAAVQSGEYGEGVARLTKFADAVGAGSHDSDLKGYVKFRAISADYGRQLRESMHDDNADVAKIQDAWLTEQADFVRDFPRAPDAAEAMLQLAIAEEFAGKDDEARVWYGRIVSQFSDDLRAKKAAGAIRRLDSVGKAIPLSATSIAGRKVDLADFRGKVVLVHYWATWCEPCKEDLKTLAQLYEKYGRQGFTLIGVGLDNDRAALAEYLSRQRLDWPQLWEDGGLDSRLAAELGILTLPTMILIDKTGKVANRAVHVTQVEDALKELLK